ncbi:MAG: serine/threonine-protein kinase [Myxococcota bacterium]
MLNPSTPTTIGRYEVLALLATGGMAEVFLARLKGAVGFQRAVVIKRMLPQLARDEEFRDMFVDEARIVARLSHPNIVHVHELISNDNELYLVMEYLEGASLSALLRILRKSNGGLANHISTYIMTRVAAGLHHAHELCDDQGELVHLVHRDVSPHNIFVDYEGSVKLIDFGIAKARDRATQTTTGTIKGKFSYMAPEQILGMEVDRRADVFSCGVVFYEMATGERLFAGNQIELAHKITSDRPIDRLDKVVDGFPPALADVVERALAKDPEVRFSTALEFQRELSNVAAELFSRTKLAEEELAELMEDHFGDTKIKRRQLLTSTAADTLPPPEPTHDVDTVPSVHVHVPPASKGRPAFLVGAALLLLCAGGALWWALKTPEPPLATRAPAAAPEPAPEPPPAPAEPVQPIAQAPVHVEVRTQPPGANVLVDGALRGTSPVVIELARSTLGCRVEARLDGYETFEENVVPDVDQRLVWSLRRRPRRTSGRSRRDRRAARMTPEPSMEPERGFFRVN